MTDGGGAVTDFNVGDRQLAGLDAGDPIGQVDFRSIGPFQVAAFHCVLDDFRRIAFEVSAIDDDAALVPDELAPSALP